MHQTADANAPRSGAWFAARGWPDALLLAALSLASGLGTFSLVMMKHDRRDATRIVSQVLRGDPVRPLDKTWYGPDSASMAMGIALFSLGWALLLAPTVRLGRDRYTGMRRAAVAASVVAVVTTALATSAFLVVRHHSVDAAKAWHWGSWQSARMGFSSVLLATMTLAYLRRRRPEYLSARPPRCPRCGYDVRGTIAAGSRVCSECGSNVPEWVAQRAAEITHYDSAERLGA